MNRFNLQRFAEGDTQTPTTTTPTGANQEKGVRTYAMQFKELLPAVFAKKSYFNDFFTGGLEALDGVAFNKKAFSLKACDIPVAVGTGYDKTDFAKKSYFNDFFTGGLEALDGVAFNKKAFSLKACDIPVAVGTGYDKTDTKAFKTGTGSTTRFGNRTEIIYDDIDVEYSWGWNFHEGIDRHTVNNSMDQAI